MFSEGRFRHFRTSRAYIIVNILLHYYYTVLNDLDDTDQKVSPPIIHLEIGRF